MITINDTIANIKFLKEFLNDDLSKNHKPNSAIAVWGTDEPNILIQKKENKEPSFTKDDFFVKSSEKVIRLAHGIISSYSTNEDSFSLYQSFQGVYFDSRHESNIESLLRSSWTPDEQDNVIANLALQMINKYRITKTNDYPQVSFSFFLNNGLPNVLLIDQPIGDESVIYGSSNEQTFNDMLLHVFHNADIANIYIKLHPDTINYGKEGYLQKLLHKHNLYEHPLIHVIEDNYNIASFFNFVDEVFVVTSQVGFEALLRGKTVSCFGMPFYSGWGLTNDMQVSTKPKPERTIIDLFVAIMLKYTSYINPFTQKIGNILDLLEYISLQQRHNLKQEIAFYKSNQTTISSLKHSVKSKIEINNSKKLPKYENYLILTDNEKSYDEIVNQPHHAFVRDGFMFSSNINKKTPSSIIIDYNGSYFNPKNYTDLEFLLNHEQFTEYEYIMAENFLIAYHNKINSLLEKESSGLLNKIKQENSDKKIIFVPGQDEECELFMYGSTKIKSNLQLVSQLCSQVENSVIIYKPFIDPKSSKDKMVEQSSLKMLNNTAKYKNNVVYIEKKASISHCINIADEIHTINSNVALDAILKKKIVVTYGLPFYGGHGLTIDTEVFPRQKCQLSLEEFVLGTYLLYPRYNLYQKDYFLSAYYALELYKPNDTKFNSYKATESKEDTVSIIDPISEMIDKLKILL